MSPMFVDVEQALIVWLRAHPLTSDLDVWHALPDGALYPAIEVTRVGGLPDKYVPVESPRIMFQVWGKNKKEAGDAARDLMEALWKMSSEQLDLSTFGYGAKLEGHSYAPDNANKLKRYVVIATVTIRGV